MAIVGAGYTGLWTAYYLKRARPALEIVVLERELAGFGASGRNGGWVSGFFSGSAACLRTARGRAGYAALQRAMFATVEEIGASSREHEIEADFVKGGHLAVALGGAQAQRLREELAQSRMHGLDERDLRELRAGELRGAVRVAGRAARRSRRTWRACTRPSCSAAWRRRSSASACASTSARRVSAIRPHEALTPAGARARSLGGARDRGLHRRPAGPAARAGADEQLDDRHRAARAGGVGGDRLGGREVLSDGAHVYVYLQRTADGRIAIGGRGVPYRFGSRTGGARRDGGETIASLRAKLLAMFPAPRRRGVDARVVGRAGRAARLVRVGRRRPRHGARVGGRIRRARASPPPTSPRACCAT